MKEKTGGGSHSELNRETGAAQAGVPTQRSLGAVRVIVAHPHLARIDCFDEDDAVGADACPAGRQSLDRRGVLEVAGHPIRRVEHDEIVA